MHEAYNKNFERAISLYKVAEKKLVKIPDDIEAAEFYFKVSWLYMSLRQNAVSLNYAKDAMNIYKMYDGYKKKLAISQVVMGTNYMQMQRFKALKTQRNTSRNRLKFQRRLAIHF